MKVFIYIILCLGLLQVSFSQTSGGWAELNSDDLRSEEVEELIDEGALYAVQQAIANGSLPQGNYTVDHVFDAWDQVVAGTNYEFDVEVSNSDSDIADIDYQVYQDLSDENEFNAADNITIVQEISQKRRPNLGRFCPAYSR